MSDDDHKHIISSTRPILIQLIELGNLCVEKNSDEYNCLDKIKQCLKIIDYIEEDFEVISIMSEKNRLTNKIE